MFAGRNHVYNNGDDASRDDAVCDSSRDDAVCDASRANTSRDDSDNANRDDSDNASRDDSDNASRGDAVCDARRDEPHDWNARRRRYTSHVGRCFD